MESDLPKSFSGILIRAVRQTFLTICRADCRLLWGFLLHEVGQGSEKDRRLLQLKMVI